MKKKITICLIGLVLMLALFGGFAAIADREPIPEINTTVPQTDPGTDGSTPAHDIPAIEVLPTESVSETTTPEIQTPTAPATEPHKENEPAESKPAAGKNPSEKPTQPKPTTPKPSAPKPTEPQETTAPVATRPPQTLPSETVPEESEPRDMTPPITAPSETEPDETIPETTEPAAPEITYEFKRQVASYAAQYINQYRGSVCTILPGMSQVAQYRAGQLTRTMGTALQTSVQPWRILSMAGTSMPPSSVMTPAIPTGKQTLPRPSVPASTAPIPKLWARRSLT